MEDKEQDKPATKPDAETLHTTDPQENMKGPLSSLMQGIKHGAEEGGKHDQEKIEQQEAQKDNGTK